MGHFSENLDPSVGTHEQLPLLTLLPRAWIAFGKAPWQCVGRSTLVLLSATGLAVVGQDLRLVETDWLAKIGDLVVVLSLIVPLIPLIGLLQLADDLLPGGDPPKPPVRWRWLWRQSGSLLLLETVVATGGLAVIQSLSWIFSRISTTLAGVVVVIGGLLLISWLFSQILALPLLVHHRYRALQAMDHSRQLVRHNILKAMALIGMLIGLNLLGLIGATLGLLLSLPFSALLLMGCCRTQTPLSNDSRRNMFPT